MKKISNNLLELKQINFKQEKISKEIELLTNNQKQAKGEEKELITLQINSLKKTLKVLNSQIPTLLEEVSVITPLKGSEISSVETKNTQPRNIMQSPEKVINTPILNRKFPRKSFFDKIEISNEKKFTNLEKGVIKRAGKIEKITKEDKKKEIRGYTKTAISLFGGVSETLANKHMFRDLKRNLIKSNIHLVPKTYISRILFTTLLALIGSFLIFLFLLFFNIGLQLPIISFVNESILTRFLKVFWIIFVLPLGTFILMYSYPSLERKSAENKLNEELPFAAIHMSAIAGSLVDPTKIFSIIISTKEYPLISKEFTKLMNQINLYGHDLVSALRELSFNSASPKFSELLNGLSTTINSGGDLTDFFEKRAETLLFDYKLERERKTKAAETFMDIYISVVIAAPMILMLLLMMMKISGLGISLSSSMISLVMVLGVTLVNIGFLTFLHLRQP